MSFYASMAANYQGALETAGIGILSRLLNFAFLAAVERGDQVVPARAPIPGCDTHGARCWCCDTIKQLGIA